MVTLHHTYYILAGRHCQHVETSSSASVATSCSSSLEDYLNTLNVSCEGDEGEAAILTWTPDDNTPDLVYYQVINTLLINNDHVIRLVCQPFSLGMAY